MLWKRIRPGKLNHLIRDGDRPTQDTPSQLPVRLKPKVYLFLKGFGIFRINKYILLFEILLISFYQVLSEVFFYNEIALVQWRNGNLNK